MKKCNNFLKENGKISQSRFYLLVSVIFYYITQGIILFAGMFNWDVDKEILTSVANGIEYPMTTFATYTLGGKIVSIFKKEKNENEN